MEKTTEPKTKVKPEVKQEVVRPFTKAAQVHSKPKANVEAKPIMPAPAPTAKPEVKQPAKVESPKPADKPVEKPEAKRQPIEPYPDLETQAQEIAPITLLGIVKAIGILRDELAKQGGEISMLKEVLSRKRKAVPNGKVQIKDTLTGKIYRSKNNAYKSLLASGELAELIKQGVFGADPAKNTFGWYALNRAFPGRFEEIKAEVPEQKA